MGVALIVSATGTWATGTLLTKKAVDHSALQPAAVLSVQLIASVVVLTVAAAARHQLPRRHWIEWRHGFAGLLEPGLSHLLFVAGLAATSAGHASLLGALEPVFVPLVAWVIWRQRPSGSLAVLVGVVAAGSALVVLGGSSGGGAAASGVSLRGDALVLGGVAAAACYVTVSARSVGALAPVPLALVQQVVALVASVAVTLVAMPSVGLGHATLGQLLLMATSGVVTLAVPFPLYLASLGHLDAPVAAQYLALIPVFGFTGALVFLGERMTAIQLVGGIVIVGSLAMSSRAAVRRPSAASSGGPQTHKHVLRSADGNQLEAVRAC